MALCKYCEQKIEWQKSTTGKWLPVEEHVVYYNDCDPDVMLVTLTGDTYKISEHSSYPNIKGRLLHTPNCKARRTDRFYEEDINSN